jgi:type VI secretion system protein ImpM
VSVSGAAGWYGKIASLGDFASRRLPHEMIAQIDAWLQRMLLGGQARLGENWLHTYLTGPVWRFIWCPGLFGTTGWSGVLMPSVDKVGRYFPLVVATPTAGIPPTGQDFDSLLEWLARVEAAALQTLDLNHGVSDFDAALAACGLPVPTTTVPMNMLLPALHGEESQILTLPSPSALFPTFSDAGVSLLADTARGCGLWWAPVPGSDGLSFFTCRGMPSEDLFVRMLQGADVHWPD